MSRECTNQENTTFEVIIYLCDEFINVVNEVVHVLVTEDGRVKQVKGSLSITIVVSPMCLFIEHLISK